MDFDSSSKFISSLAKFLQSLCNGYVEFDSGVEVIGHIYLNVDTGRKIDYVLNEKVCKTDENSVTFISNSFHAQPAEKPKPSKTPKSSDQNKPSDPGGLHGDDDELMILGSGEAKNPSLELRDGPTFKTEASPMPKSNRTPISSKRSYSQSFPQSHKQSAKFSRTDTSVHSPNGAHQDNDSVNSEKSNFLASHLPEVHPSSETNSSQLPSAFPQTISDSSSNQISLGKNIKQEPDSDMNLLHVKQEYDPSGHDEESEAYDESQDQSMYSGIYDEQYYSGSKPSQNLQRVDFNPSGSGGHGEFFQGIAGASGDLGDASDIWRCRYQCDICLKRLRSAWELRDHKNSVHFKVLAFTCNGCGKRFAYKRSLKRHMETSCASVRATSEGLGQDIQMQ